MRNIYNCMLKTQMLACSKHHTLCFGVNKISGKKKKKGPSANTIGTHVIGKYKHFANTIENIP